VNTIHCGDALTILKTIPTETVHSVITSPPYWGLRDYGVNGQLGLEKTPEEFIAKMVEVFREVKRVLRSDGTLWLNIGDSYCGSWGNYSGKNRGAGRQRIIRNGSVVPNPAYDGHEAWRPTPTSHRRCPSSKKN
jgi:site-specific DNA-methyltransferase (adenine-specific)